MLGAPSAQAASRVFVKLPGQAATGERVALDGIVRVKGISRVGLQVRGKHRWRTSASARVRHSRFRLTWRAPSKSGTLRVRLVGWRHSRPVILISPRSLTVRARAVQQAPAPSASVPEQPLPPKVIIGREGLIEPDRVTTITNGGYSLTVPAGTVNVPTTATVEPTDSANSEVSGPAVAVHINGDWQNGVKKVRVSLPIDSSLAGLGDGWEIAVVHDIAGGDHEIFAREALDVDAGHGVVSVETTSLSIFHSSSFPSLSIISAPSSSLKASEIMLRLLRQFTGHRASQPSCSPAMDSARTSTLGSAFEPVLLFGNEPGVKYCITDGGAKANWTLANNTGAVLHYTVADDGQVESVGPTGDLLSEPFYEALNDTFNGAKPGSEVDVAPGATATVSVPAGSDGHVSFAASPGLLIPTFVLQQIGGLVPGPDEAKKLYAAINDCGWSFAVSGLKSLSSALRCAMATNGIAGTRLAKIIEKPLLLLNAALSELATISVQVSPTEGFLKHLAFAPLGSWSAAVLPLPGVGSQGGQLTSVSCPTTETCVAVGEYQDAMGNTQGLLARRTNGTWTTATAPLPTGSACGGGACLSSVVCPSASVCHAVGSIYDEGVPKGLIETYSSGSWSASVAPLASDGCGGFGPCLSKLACPDTTHCVAIGVGNTGHPTGHIVALAGGIWTAQVAPQPPNSPDTYMTLNSVTCPSAGKCIVVGQHGHDPQALIETLTNGVWQASDAPLLAQSFTNTETSLSAVSCSTPTSCVAVGQYVRRTAGENYWGPAFIEDLAGGVWTPTEAPLPPNSLITNAHIDTVGCASSAVCVAAGNFQPDGFGSPRGLLEAGGGQSWTATQLPSPGRGYAGAIACSTGPDACVAVGSDGGSGTTPPLIEKYSGQQWAGGPLPNLPPAWTGAELNSVSCPATGACVAVGRALSASSAPLIETEGVT